MRIEKKGLRFSYSLQSINLLNTTTKWIRTMDISILQEELKNKFMTLLPRNEYLAEDDTFAIIDFIECSSHLHRQWCWISIKGRCTYDTEAPWADYSSSTNVNLEYSWIGLVAELPTKVSMATLSEWARYKTEWTQKIEKDDTDYTYTHDGALVEDMHVYRTLAIKKANGVNEAASKDDRWIFENQYISMSSLSS